MPTERDLFANFERMRREMDELFGDVLKRSGIAPNRRAGFSPAVDVYYMEGPPRAIVRAELAGVDPDSISLEIEHGPFRRVVELGAAVRGDEARATYEDGILRVELPLVAGPARARRVPVQARSGSGDGA